MDGQKQPEPVVNTDAPAKQPRRSIMDIRRPKTEAASPTPPEPASAVTKPTPEKPAEATAVATPPPEEPAEKSDNPAETLEEPKKSKTPKPPKPPKQPRQPGVGLAIFATMIIILGLGALATYAYLRTNNIAPF